MRSLSRFATLSIEPHPLRLVNPRNLEIIQQVAPTKISHPAPPTSTLMCRAERTAQKNQQKYTEKLLSKISKQATVSAADNEYNTSDDWCEDRVFAFRKR